MESCDVHPMWWYISSKECILLYRAILSKICAKWLEFSITRFTTWKILHLQAELTILTCHWFTFNIADILLEDEMYVTSSITFLFRLIGIHMNTTQNITACQPEITHLTDTFFLPLHLPILSSCLWILIFTLSHSTISSLQVVSRVFPFTLVLTSWQVIVVLQVMYPTALSFIIQLKRWLASISSKNRLDLHVAVYVTDHKHLHPQECTSQEVVASDQMVSGPIWFCWCFSKSHLD